MTVRQFLLLLCVAGLAGGLGQALAGYSRGGCLASIALGFIGALLGSWLAGLLGLPGVLVITIGGEPFPLIWSILGAALFVAVLGALSKRRRIPDKR
jgi:uncharacterized membrane protein YeaQ/YmgE (transglycosylase-associated protein family)